MSWSVSGISPSPTTCASWTVVTTTVSGPMRPASHAIAYSRSENPPPLPSRPPSGLTATPPVTTTSTGSSSATEMVRALRLAPLIELAFRGASASSSGSRRKKGSSSARRGTAMKTVMPSSNARCRTGHCGESGFALTVRAPCQAGSVRSSSAAASAPTKFGMRWWGAGKRPAPAATIASQTRSRSSAFAARSSGSPPASWSWRRGLMAPAAPPAAAPVRRCRPA